MFTNFQFDKEFASDYGLLVCTFNNTGTETVSSGSTLTFNTKSSFGSDEFNLFGVQYDNPYTATFQLVKNPCLNSQTSTITPDEYSQINKWLTRKNFCEFRINEIGYENIVFFGSFNIQAIKIAGMIKGIECTFTSSAPYAYDEEVTSVLSGKDFTIYSFSDEIGEICPDVEIIINEDGDLRISNSLDDEALVINSCTKGEVLSINPKSKIITSSLMQHDQQIANDFNFNYIKICNNYDNNLNHYKASLDITMTIKYRPVRKIGI